MILNMIQIYYDIDGRLFAIGWFQNTAIKGKLWMEINIVSIY